MGVFSGELAEHIRGEWPLICSEFRHMLSGAISVNKNTSADHKMSDRQLMQLVLNRWGKAVESACRCSSVPPEFLAALIANESSGDAEKQSFRDEAYERLICVRSGKQFPHWPVVPAQLRAMSDAQLTELATAWGLTQVMGYHVLGNGSLPERLLVPEFNLLSALQRLAGFSESCGLDMCSEYEDMFRCWAAGRPDGVPADPFYVEKGMRRLALYREMTRFESLPAAA